MHFTQFVTKLKEVKNYEELCKGFRINANNLYEYFTEQMELETITYPLDDISDLKYDWMHVDVDIILEICNDIDVKYKGANLDNGEDGPYYWAYISDLWDILNEVKEDEKFMLAMIDFIRLNGNPHIQEFIVEPLSERLEQQGLGDFIAKKAFVAMWFDDSMKNAREAIKEAINHCGYIANIIDEKEHNNYIVPEILYEIEKSKFLVSDLTGNRGGVYYEAGYAKAIGKEVILTAKKTEKTHFDVAQMNTIFWETEDELKDRLITRIKATIK